MHLITVDAHIQSPLTTVWSAWTQAEHVQHWNFASSDWHCPSATNDLRTGGEFHYTMAAKDGCMEFDFWGTHEQIISEKQISTLLGDGRHMSVYFESTPEGTRVREEFEPEKMNPEEMQQMGWQMILNNFKSYAEGLAK